MLKHCDVCGMQYNLKDLIVRAVHTKKGLIHHVDVCDDCYKQPLPQRIYKQLSLLKD